MPEVLSCALPSVHEPSTSGAVRAPERSATAALALLAALLLPACDPGPHSLAWQIRFADPTLAPRARVFQATIYLGGCASGTAIFDAELLPDGTTTAAQPPDLAPGVHGFGAVARDSTCTDFASGCVDRTLPSDDAFVVELVESPGGPACIASQCGDGRCGRVDAGIVDGGGLDGAARDAGSVDAAGLDAGAADAGSGSECASGFGDCDGVASNGCEVNLLTSKPNCGTCGHHCTGGALASCCSGMCVPGRCP